MEETERAGLICAYRLDGRGGGDQLDWNGVRSWQPGMGLRWVHLDYSRGGEVSGEWMRREGGLDGLTIEALLAPESRPRLLVQAETILVILRGVNLNPGADPEDMVSLRFWSDGHQIITTRRRRLLAIQDLRDDLAAMRGPRDAGEFLVSISGRLVERIGTVVADLDDAIDALEDEVLEAQSRQLRSRIADLRRQAIGLRRYIAPQRDVMVRLQGERLAWLDDISRARIREIGDRVTRSVEDLDAARDRAAVCQDELNTRLSDQMNRTMYLLSIVAAIFLPLGLITGLLGINVGGIPGAEEPSAFLLVSLGLMVIAGVQIAIFRRKHWI